MRAYGAHAQGMQTEGRAEAGQAGSG
jgi:hypothetical protein